MGEQVNVKIQKNEIFYFNSNVIYENCKFIFEFEERVEGWFKKFNVPVNVKLVCNLKLVRNVKLVGTKHCH